MIHREAMKSVSNQPLRRFHFISDGSSLGFGTEPVSLEMFNKSRPEISDNSNIQELHLAETSIRIVLKREFEMRIIRHVFPGKRPCHY